MLLLEISELSLFTYQNRECLAHCIIPVFVQWLVKIVLYKQNRIGPRNKNQKHTINGSIITITATIKKDIPTTMIMSVWEKEGEKDRISYTLISFSTHFFWKIKSFLAFSLKSTTDIFNLAVDDFAISLEILLTSSLLALPMVT